MAKERIYNKLVRDNIPAEIRRQGEIPLVRTLKEEEFTQCLKAKLQEETQEFLEDMSLEELADILEVLEALAALQGWKDWDIREAKRQKILRKGSFRERVFLQKVWEK